MMPPDGGDGDRSAKGPLYKKRSPEDGETETEERPATKRQQMDACSPGDRLPLPQSTQLDGGMINSLLSNTSSVPSFLTRAGIPPVGQEHQRDPRADAASTGFPHAVRAQQILRQLQQQEESRRSLLIQPLLNSMTSSAPQSTTSVNNDTASGLSSIPAATSSPLWTAGSQVPITNPPPTHGVADFQDGSQLLRNNEARMRAVMLLEQQRLQQQYHLRQQHRQPSLNDNRIDFLLGASSQTTAALNEQTSRSTTGGGTQITTPSDAHNEEMALLRNALQPGVDRTRSASLNTGSSATTTNNQAALVDEMARRYYLLQQLGLAGGVPHQPASLASFQNPLAGSAPPSSFLAGLAGNADCRQFLRSSRIHQANPLVGANATGNPFSLFQPSALDRSTLSGALPLQHQEMNLNALLQAQQQHQEALGLASSSAETDKKAGGGAVIDKDAFADREEDGLPKSFPTIIAMPDDGARLSKHQVFLRHQIELFEATAEDISTHTRGRNRPIQLGQIGIRCRHCAHVPIRSRQKGSTYFPGTTVGLYQAAQNMCTTHMQCGICSEMPLAIKKEFAQLISTKVTSSGAGRPYWAKAVRRLGLIDTDDGIRIRSTKLKPAIEKEEIVRPDEKPSSTAPDSTTTASRNDE